MKWAICDHDAVLPLERLVLGPFTDPEDLPAIERFIRTCVLHDEMRVEVFPKRLHFKSSGQHIDDAEARRFHISLDLFESLFMVRDFELSVYVLAENKDGNGTVLVHNKNRVPDIDLRSEVIELTSRYAGSDGQFVSEAYLASLRRVFADVKSGGSALLEGDFGKLAINIVHRYPEALFHDLDQSWQQYARQLDEEGLQLTVPPLLGIVLTRCARRDAIPAVIRDLRDEWAVPRRKVWSLLDALKMAHTMGEALDIGRELSEASKLFSPEPTEHDSRPIRILWEIVAAAMMGTATTAFSGVKPIVGAITGVLAHVPRSVPALLHEFGPAVFGRGAFDLARRVRRATARVEFDTLSRLLTEAEGQNWGSAHPLAVNDVPASGTALQGIVRLERLL